MAKAKLTDFQKKTLKDFYVYNQSLTEGARAKDVEVSWSTNIEGTGERVLSCGWGPASPRYRGRDEVFSETLLVLMKKGFIEYDDSEHPRLRLTKHGEWWIKNRPEYSDLLAEKVAIDL